MITKRMVGIALGVLGLLTIMGSMTVDLVGAGNWSGIGPAQQQAIGFGLIVSLIGLSLIPLGDKPA